MDRQFDPTAILQDLTLEEKASLCLGADIWHTAPIARLGVPSVMVSDGPHGLRRQPEDADHINSGSVPATCFPTASALGSSWNPGLVRRVAEAIGQEARAQGVAVVLGPGINIKRSPLCGRNFEYYSEDPLVAGRLGAAFVDGVQSQGVGASVKHFAANNQETDRLRVSADVDERALREIYLPAFERVIAQSRPWTVMCAYNRLNGVYASQHRWLLTDVMRGEWGFDGVVVSDWGAVHDRVAALAAGLDLEMPPNSGVSDAAIVAAVRDGSLAEATLDKAVLRVLHLVHRATDSHRAAAPSVDADAHHELARAAAVECAVLLKNDDMLPLQPVDGDVVAVIGEFARTPRYQGAGSSQVNPTRVDVPIDAIRAAVPEGVKVSFAPGFGIGHDGDDETLAEEAVRLARDATYVVAFLGLPAADESEGFDREHIDLPRSQMALLERLTAVHTKVAVVLSNGSVVGLAPWHERVPSILECWLSGQAGAGAVADLLLGTANPSGRLAESIPLRLQDNPSYLNFPGESGHVRYGEGIFVGYRGYDAIGREVCYPFGHGLSYTTFDYADLSVEIAGRVEDETLTITVAFTMTNTGRRHGAEVAQLYVGDPVAQVARPVRELKAFEKVSLDPKASTTVTFGLTARDLSYWSGAQHRWVLEGGVFDLAVGASSRDLRLTATVDVPGPPVSHRLDSMATLKEWLADPDGSAALREAVGVGPDGRARGIVGDDELIKIIGNFPLATLAAFKGLGIDHTVVARLTEMATKASR